MHLRTPLVLLAVMGSLMACGETHCDSSSTDADDPHDASCQETGSNDHAG